MSFDATRAVWAARDSGALCGGSTLFVALALADRADKATGTISASTRGLVARCHLSAPTVTRALRDLQEAGVVEVTARGIGTRPTRWRWLLTPPSTGITHGVDDVGQRAISETLTNGQREKNVSLRVNPSALACKSTTQNQDQYLNQGAPTCNPRLPEAADPAEISARVATLRDALNGGRTGAVGRSVPTPADGALFTHEARP